MIIYLITSCRVGSDNTPKTPTQLPIKTIRIKGDSNSHLTEMENGGEGNFCKIILNFIVKN